jgi:RHS repeat-associated protein
LPELPVVARRYALTLVSAVLLAGMLSAPLAAQMRPLYSGVMVSVTPAKTSDTVIANGALDSVSFTVKNTGSVADKFNVWKTCTTISCPTSANPNPPGPFSLSVNASVTVWVKFYHPTSPVSGSVQLTAADTADMVERTGTTTVLGSPAGPLPVVDLSPFNANNQDVARCAASCFAASYAQGTVPYFSLDTPRNVTLVYRGDRVAAQPFVQVNVTHGGNSGNLPNAFYLEVKKADGSLITFLNGETKLRFTAPSTSTYRLAGQFDAANNSMSTTGVYPITIIVGAEYSGGTAETWDSTTVIVVNEAGSPIARGWTVAGIQHLYVQSDGTVLITDGTGSAVHFTGGPNTFTSPVGEFSQLTFNGSYYFRKYPDSTTVTFASNGDEQSVADRWGTTTRVRYTSNKVDRILDPTDTTKVIQFSYGSYGLSGITDPGSRTTSVSVDASGRLTSITDPDDVSTNFGYEGCLRLSTITDRRGNTTTLGYDSQAGTLASSAAPSIQVVNTDGSLTNAAPTTQYAAWQKVGVPYSSTSGTPFSSVLASQAEGSVTDPGGHATTFTVNSFGQPLVVTDALGSTTTATYSAGLPNTVTYPTGGTDTTSYYNGQVTYRHPAGGPRTWYHYSGWADVPDSIYGDLPTIRQYVSSPGRVDSLRIGGSQLRRFTYTSDGRVHDEANAGDTVIARHSYSGAYLDHSRDSLPGGRLTYYYQDGFGRDTAVAAPQLRTRITHYDVLNRAVAAYDSAGATPTASYYGAATLDSVKDAKSQTYRFAYNALGWLTQRMDPAGATDTSKYSRDGEIRLWTNRRGQQVQFTYDALHRPVSKSGTNTTTEAWSYSSNQRVLTATSPVDTETTYLSVSGQPDSTLTTMAGQNFWRRYWYTAARFTDSVCISGGGITFMARKYHYSTAGTVDSIVLNALTTAVSTNANGVPVGRAFPSGQQVTYQSNPMNDLSQSYTGAPYDTSVVLSVAYDSLGRVSKQGFGVSRTGRQFSYDAVGRLVADSTLRYLGTPPQYCSGNPEPPVDDYGNGCIDNGWYTNSGTTYGYDAVGNRTDQGGTYGSANRITAFASCTYGTDADGNVTARACSGQTVTFYWSAESRLDSATVAGQRLAFKYDALGRLVRKDTSGVVERYFLWDGDNLLAELTGAATGKVAEYSYYGTDRLHALILGTTPYYAHQDAVGNTVALSDTVLRRTYGFDEWGNLASGADRLPFSGVDRARWKGALWLGPELDVYYMRGRWYEPVTGRFLSEDPLGLAAGVNPYVYAADDPVDGTDPSGLDEGWPDWLETVWNTLAGGGVSIIVGAEICVRLGMCQGPPNTPRLENPGLHGRTVTEVIADDKSKKGKRSKDNWGYTSADEMFGGGGFRDRLMQVLSDIAAYLSFWNTSNTLLGALEMVD